MSGVYFQIPARAHGAEGLPTVLFEVESHALRFEDGRALTAKESAYRRFHEWNASVGHRFESLPHARLAAGFLHVILPPYASLPADLAMICRAAGQGAES